MENKNGFLVVGAYWKNDKNVYKCIAKCKVCFEEFETNYHSLHRMKSCGCARPKQLKELPEYINGFRSIKCHGYDVKRGVRWATVECKICKRIYEVDPNKLRYRKHCGCMHKNVIVSKYKYGFPQLSQTYHHMKARCYKENNRDFYNYGARGIKICEEWLKDRNAFCEWALANGFENNKKLSIDRIDSNGDYTPENCRWANAAIQGRNTRRNVLTMELAEKMRIDRDTMTLRELALKYCVSYSTASNVVNNLSWVT